LRGNAAGGDRRLTIASMDLKSLKYVSSAIRLQSISKAAEELYIAQPALSRKIKLLEDELGVTLLVRHRRGVTATAEGLKVMALGDTMERLARQLRDDMLSQATDATGKIRFGYLIGPGELFIGKMIAEFMREHPKVTFSLREGSTHELSEALLADKLDLALMIYDVKYHGLRRKALFAEDVWLAGSPSAWPFGSEPLRVEHLANLPLVHAAGIGSAIDKLAAQHNIQMRSAIEGDTRAAARHAASAGVAFMLMPASSVRDDIREGRLVGAPITGFEVQRGLFWRSDSPLSRAVVEFVKRIDATVACLKRDQSSMIRDIAKAK
jgi:LysR family nitrogen assimilation transcriptional regulator